MPGCLDVRLVEAWEHEVTEVDLELSVKVLHAIRLIFERVKALTTVRVLRQNLHCDFIGTLFQILWLKVDNLINENFLVVTIFVLNQILVNGQ